MIFDGHNGGTVEVLENVLVIRRKGLASALAQGLKGEKRIPWSSITSVQFKEPGLTTGYIQFGVIGGLEGRGGVFNAAADENTVLFVKKALEDFRRLKDLVEARIGVSTVSAAPTSAPSFSYAEELGRLADLRDRGVLSDEEFLEEKASLQRRRATADGTVPEPTAPQRQFATAPGSAQDKPESPSRSSGSKAGKGCLILIAIVLGLMVLGALLGPGEGSKGSTAIDNVSGPASEAAGQSSATAESEEPAQERLSAPQRNAVRSAEQYLSISGFSRAGLIEQLSSSAGNGFSVEDATIAVDSMTVDWRDNAARSAKQYMSISGFSCSGLIEQLSSEAGSKYTRDEAKYGARQAGAC